MFFHTSVQVVPSLGHIFVILIKRGARKRFLRGVVFARDKTPPLKYVQSETGELQQLSLEVPRYPRYYFIYSGQSVLAWEVPVPNFPTLSVGKFTRCDFRAQDAVCGGPRLPTQDKTNTADLPTWMQNELLCKDALCTILITK